VLVLGRIVEFFGRPVTYFFSILALALIRTFLNEKDAKNGDDSDFLIYLFFM
jgi:hypothetical protein